MKIFLKCGLIPLFLLAMTCPAALTVTNIASGNYAYHSLFIKSDGSLWAMGDNQYGQLGSGTLKTTNRPEQIVAGGVTAIAAGGNHSLFLKSDGSLWAMGQNNFGQLGDGTLSQTNKPEQITNGVVAIAAGGNSGVALSGGGQSLFLKSDGSLWAMGDNNGGQLGDGTFNSTNRPEQIVPSGVTAIATGAGHSLFIKSDGSLWAMGYNIYGELGDGFVDTSYPADYGIDLPEQILPSPQPVLAGAVSSTTNIQLKATTGFGGSFHLLAGTNLATALQWTPLRTNSITARGTNNYSVTVTNALNPGGGQFYILQSQ